MEKAHKKHHLTSEAFELIAARFRILGDPMRLKILHALGNNEMNVTQLMSAIECRQANISKHLNVLLSGGFLRRRKQGLHVFYRIADAAVFELCELVCSGLAENLDQQKELMKIYSVVRK
ncbi:metalloregulator ArsR/SmtB family transcription factor [bacterium]|nr:metalloregulator ArsR/SmtB family transcription factor [bacterium]